MKNFGIENVWDIDIFNIVRKLTRGCVKTRFQLKTAVICEEQPLPKNQ